MEIQKKIESLQPEPGTLFLKVPKELPALLIKHRERCGKYSLQKHDKKFNRGKAYQVNRSLKGAGLFCVLKAITTTGTIQNYDKCMDQLCKITKCDPGTFMKYLKYADQLGLLTYTWKKGKKKNIYLYGWKEIGEGYEFKNKEFFTVKYDFTNEKIKAHHLLAALEIRNSQQSQENMVNVNLIDNPWFILQLKNEGLTPNRGSTWMDAIRLQQEYSFKHGTKHKNIHFINCDTQRTARTICRKHNYKTFSSVHDFKKRLALLGLATITRRIRVGNGTYDKNRFTTYDVNNSKRTTWMPDKITLNTAIFLD